MTDPETSMLDAAMDGQNVEMDAEIAGLK